MASARPILPASGLRHPANRRRGDNPPGPPGEERGGMMRSSLELVFSYSRSQQMFFGDHLPSAPSFVDHDPNLHGRSNEHSSASPRPRRWISRRLQGDVEDGMQSSSTDEEMAEDDDEEDYDEEYTEDEESPGVTSEEDPGSHPSDNSPSLFPADPVSRRGSSLVTSSSIRNQHEENADVPQHPKSTPMLTKPLPPVSPLAHPSNPVNPVSNARPGLISLFNPNPFGGYQSPRLGTSAGTGSSGSQTPKAVPRNLPSEARRGSYGFPVNRIVSVGEDSRGQAQLDDQIDPKTSRPQSPSLLKVEEPDTENTPLLSSRHTPRSPVPIHDTGGLSTVSTPARDVSRKVSLSPSISMGQRSPRIRSRRASEVRRRSSAGTSLRRRKSEFEMGSSTDGQTLFNAVAVLVGIGLLSLPLAFAYAGWIGGVIMLLGFGYITNYTAKLLARLILSDRSLRGYTDLGRRAFGGWAGTGITALFCLELFALAVAFIVLFGDTLGVLFPSLSANTFKIICFFIVVPTTLLPLSLLSLPSLLSTMSTLLLLIILILDGFLAPSTKGSLIHPEPTSLWPELTRGNWLGGIGLILAGFGGHAVVPSLALDMRYPQNFDRVINKAFFIATLISFFAGAAGYLMIGETVSDEITKDLMQEKYHYPRLLNIFALWMIVISPISKFGLCSRPLNVTVETLLNIIPHTVPPLEIFKRQALDAQSPPNDTVTGTSTALDAPRSAPDSATPQADPTSIVKQDSPLSTGIPTDPHEPTSSSHIALHAKAVARERTKAASRVVSRIIVTGFCTLAAILIPGFGKVMAFLGSFSAFLICIILPLIFYTRLEPLLIPPAGRISAAVRRIHGVVLVVSVGLMAAGTIWAFLPNSGHGDLE